MIYNKLISVFKSYIKQISKDIDFWNDVYFAFFQEKFNWNEFVVLQAMSITITTDKLGSKHIPINKILAEYLGNNDEILSAIKFKLFQDIRNSI